MAAGPAAQGAPATKWVTLSTGNIGITPEPSIARFGHGYEVVWVARTGSTEAIHARILSAAGKPIGPQHTVVGGWANLALDPTILTYNGQRAVAFSGGKTGKSGPYDTDAEYMATSTNGTSWPLYNGSLSANDGASQGNTAVIAVGTTTIAGFTRQQGLVYHIGVPSSADPQPGPDPETAKTGNASASPGLGKDAKTGQVWALWYSNSGIIGQDGVNAQVISPTPGSRVHAPGSSSPKTLSVAAEQDLSAVERIGGGIYTAYRSPNALSIVVWKVGASKPVATIHDTRGVGYVTMAAAPGGRVWLYWSDGDGWRATRSNKAATKFGPALTAKVPNGDDEGGFLAGNGAAGPLEAVATIINSKGQQEVIARQFLPKLKATVKPHSVKGGKSFTVKVTDAGDAVKGATVHFNGHKKKTSKKGIAKFKASGVSKGKHSITVAFGGYVGASTKVTIT